MEKLKKTIIIVFVVGIFFVPVVSTAGSLEPSGAPAPTMKTLDQIPPTWSQKLPAAQRFELVLDGEAVLDKETGLVWEKDVQHSTNSWYLAIRGCFAIGTGGRKGWRLPTREELESLVDPSIISPSLPALPAGHPFLNVVWGVYWSGTTDAQTPSAAWVVDFRPGYVQMQGQPKVDNHYYWCVRGGKGYDAY